MGLSGRCSCNAITYRLASAPMFVHCCHCLDCQRQTGSGFVVNMLIEADRVEAQGIAPEAVSMPTDSGREHLVYRCPKCLVALWSTYGGRPQVRFVRAGTLDEPSAIAPDVHIFTRSQLPWVRLPDGAGDAAPGSPFAGTATGRIPRAFEVYYDTAAEWPAESLARRKAAYGK